MVYQESACKYIKPINKHLNQFNYGLGQAKISLEQTRSKPTSVWLSTTFTGFYQVRSDLPRK